MPKNRRTRCWIPLCFLWWAAAAPAFAVDGAAPTKAVFAPAFALRPVAAARVIRADAAFADYEDAKGHQGSTIATTLFASAKLSPSLAAFGRIGLNGNHPPVGLAGSAFVNPVAGALYAFSPAPSWKMAALLAAAVPVGMGGGNTPDPAESAAAKSGVLARSAMDNAMFAVNDLVVFPGFGAAYVTPGWTAQVEATVLQLARIRAEKTQPDASKTNLTAGAAFSLWITSYFAATAELRYQRWLSTPAAVRADPAARDTLSFAIGPRFTVKLGEGVTARPGIAFTRGLDAPMTAKQYQIAYLDIPIAY